MRPYIWRTLGIEAGLFAAGLTATLLIAFRIWSKVGPIHYGGGDGKAFQALVLGAMQFSPPGEANVLNPLQGMFSPQIPINVWLNPAYAVFRFVDLDTGCTLSATIAFAALALSSYVLARTCRVPLGPAIAGALASIVAFAPFPYLFGLNTQYVLVPPTAFTMAVLTLALAVLVAVGRLATSSLLVWSIGLAAVLAYAIACDPMFVVAGVMLLAPCGAVLFFADATRERLLARIIVLAAAFALLWLTGLFDYIHAFVRYTVRYQYPHEIVRGAAPALASALLAHPLLASQLFLPMLVGIAFGLVLGRGRVRVLVLAVLLQWLVTLGLGALYLFGGFNWTLPLPLYFEQGAYHLYALATLVGWGLLLGRIVDWVQRRWIVKPRFAGAGGAIAGILYIPLLLVLYRIDIAPKVSTTHVEPWPAQPQLLQAVGPQASLRSDRRFRGAVALVEDFSYEARLRTIDLWRYQVPTINEYSQLVTPTMYYVVSRMLIVDPQLYPFNDLSVARAKVPFLASLGIRYLLTLHDQPLEETTVPTAVDASSPGFTHVWYLREVLDANLGQYSPTEPLPAKSAAEAVSLMDGGMDFRRQVVVSPDESLPPLASATHGAFSYGKGRIRISAAAPGHALILLPVQFSHCLRIVGSKPGARLIRANLAMTGVLFERSAELEVAFDFGFFSPRCRLADLADLETLGLKGAKDAQAPSRPEAMPYAINSFAALGEKLPLLWQHVKREASMDRGYIRICGRLCR